MIDRPPMDRKRAVILFNDPENARIMVVEGKGRVNNKLRVAIRAAMDAFNGAYYGVAASAPVAPEPEAEVKL